MENYSNSKVYKIQPVSCADEGDVYVGSTIRKLSQRMDNHIRGYYRYNEGKHHKTTCYDIFDKYGVDNCIITLIEEVNAKTKDELLKRERYYIENTMCVNKVVPTRTDKEYCEAMREKKTCECGSICSIGGFYKHIVSNKHYNYLKIKHGL
jgi:ribosome-interacting GTPase 1